MRTVDSPKKMNKHICFVFAVKSRKASKLNSFVYFLGESTARQSTYGFIWPLVVGRTLYDCVWGNLRIFHTSFNYLMWLMRSSTGSIVFSCSVFFHSIICNYLCSRLFLVQKIYASYSRILFFKFVAESLTKKEINF